MEMLLFHLVNSIRVAGRGQVTVEQAKKTKKTAPGQLLIRTREQGQENTRIAETGNTIGETFYEDIAHRQIFSLNENCFCHFKS